MAGIAYGQRPAKYIVRKLIVEICKRLWPFGPISQYEYIGMGGLEYADFELFRRELGIERMTSIEHDVPHRARYEFNVPYNNVRLVADRASSALPGLPLEGRRIVWLDYEKALRDEFIQDARGCVLRMWPSSVLIVTLHAQSERVIAGRVRALEKLVGEHRVPLGTTDEDLGEWGLAAVQRAVLEDELVRACYSRGDGSQLRILFDFQYRDGQRMHAIGFLLLGPTDARVFEQCHFSDLEFATLGGQPLTIDVPVLTSREVIHLSRQLARVTGSPIDAPGIEDSAAEAFEKFYRWFPPVRNP